jgi:hypothetical protein
MDAHEYVFFFQNLNIYVFFRDRFFDQVFFEFFFLSRFNDRSGFGNFGEEKSPHMLGRWRGRVIPFGIDAPPP